ncbi:MAG: insulinase family protein [Myxococcota bacterium]
MMPPSGAAAAVARRPLFPFRKSIDFIGLFGSFVIVLASGCASSPAPKRVAASPSNARASWQKVDRAEILGRTYETYRRDNRSPRVVWMSAAGASTSVQTWIRHRQESAAMTSPALLATVVDILQDASGPDLALRVGADTGRLSLRTIAAPERLTIHLEAHARWLCQQPRPSPRIEASVAQRLRPVGWARIGQRLSQAAWHLRLQTERNSGRAELENVQRALASWLNPADAVVVVAGPHDADDAIEAIKNAYRNCRSPSAAEPDDRATAALSPTAGPTKRNIRVPGPYRHVLAQWQLPPLPASDAVGLDGLAYYLGDSTTGPLGRALVPDLAVGIAVRHRHHPLGANLELFMTLPPAAKIADALNRVRQILRSLVDADPGEFSRAAAALRNRAHARLSDVEDAAGLAAVAVIDGQRLIDLAGRVEGLTQLTAATIQTITHNYLLRQKPVVVVGRPRGSK